MGSSLSALFTRDIYARLLATTRDDAHYVQVSRLATVVILALGFVYVPFIGSKETMLQAFLTLIPVFVTPLFTIYVIGIFTSAHSRAGFVGIMFGACYGVVALIDREIADVEWLSSWFTGRWPALLWSVLFTSLGAALATLIWGTHDSRESPVKQIGWLQSSSDSLKPMPEHPFDRPPSWLLSPEVLAAVLMTATAIILFTFFW
ncbi:MAG: Na+/proline symporter [Pirellulaceae bacterium]|jgi:Na+/proline symporter